MLRKILLSFWELPMPSHSVKQAKVMSAISHGWHPSKGSVAKIPVSVAREFHAADAGKKYGGKHKSTAGPKVANKYKEEYHRGKGKSYSARGGGQDPKGGPRFFRDRDHPLQDPFTMMPQEADPSYKGSRGVDCSHHINGCHGGDHIGRSHHSKHHGHVQPHTFRGARGRHGA
jgi:hypothetical protein